MAHTLAQLQIEPILEQMLHFNEISSEVWTQSAREYPAIVILMISTHGQTHSSKLTFLHSRQLSAGSGCDTVWPEAHVVQQTRKKSKQTENTSLSNFWAKLGVCTVTKCSELKSQQRKPVQCYRSVSLGSGVCQTSGCFLGSRPQRSPKGKRTTKTCLTCKVSPRVVQRGRRRRS